MSAQVLKREHFEKGKSFSEEDFNAFMEASRDSVKAVYTRYLPSLAGGVLVSFLFSKGIGGFAGNMLGVACIFAGLILGGVLTKKATEPANALAAKLGITQSDVVKARRYLKNNTVAWRDPDTEKRAAPKDASPAASPVKAAAAPAPITPAKRTFPPFTGTGVCDVCNRPLSEEKAYIVPNSVFYASPQWRAWYKQTGVLFLGRPFSDADIAVMQARDHSAGSAVCEHCIHMFE